MLRVEISQDQLTALKSFFDATTNEVKKAGVRTIRKTSNWIKTASVREISKRTDIAQKILRGRAKSKIYVNKMQGEFTFGIYRVSLMRLGPKQQKKGVRAGKFFRQSAFIAPIKSSTSNKYQVFKRVGKKRLPIEKQMIVIKDSVNTVIRDIVMPQIPDRIIVIFRQELRWEVSKR